MTNHLQAVILDWAGTTVDHGSLAPVAALRSVFADAGIDADIQQIRAFMGLPKKDHIRKILALIQGAPPHEEEVAAVYRAFIPRQIECLAEHSRVIAGVPQAVERMRQRGMKIGSTTGYTRPMLDYLLEEAAKQGFTPDCSVCPEDTGGGRPGPWMCYQNAIALQRYPLEKFVKIGDTPSDIDEGRNAGMWTIGITRTGNQVGLSQPDWDLLSKPDQTAALARAEDDLKHAHYIAESAADCDAILDEINARLVRGERP